MMVPLAYDECIEITVPTRCMCGRPLAIERIERAKAACLQFADGTLGGAQVGRWPVHGRWRDDHGELVEEWCVVVRSYQPPGGVARHENAVLAFADALVVDLSQHQIAVLLRAPGRDQMQFRGEPGERCQCQGAAPRAAIPRFQEAPANRRNALINQALGALVAGHDARSQRIPPPVARLRVLLNALGFSPPAYTATGLEIPADLASAFAEPPLVAAVHGDVEVLFGRCSGTRMLRSVERTIAGLALRSSRSGIVFAVFCDEAGSTWHFVHGKSDDAEGARGRFLLRRMEILAGVPCRTVHERLGAAAIAAGDSTAAVVQKLGDAFDVEAVSNDFFNGYRELVSSLAGDVYIANAERPAIASRVQAAGYARLLMERLLFLCFCARKGWLDRRADFLREEFELADAAGYSFHDDLLVPVFFDGLDRSGAQKVIGNRMMLLPYLNGGLFRRHDAFGERAVAGGGVSLENGKLAPVVRFLSRFNFTVTEATPLDRPVEIDPEMLGRVFENLLEEDVRHQQGTYYTPRTVVQFMCREALCRYLMQHVAGVQRATLAEVWADDLGSHPEPMARTVAVGIKDALERVRVLDHAVGSGAFPLGMMQEMVLLHRACAEAMDMPAVAFEERLAKLKRSIAERNLYGIDIRPEAVEIARLRLWLAMVVDEDEPEPLPNLDFRVIVGDSLREKLGGMALGEPPPASRGGLTLGALDAALKGVQRLATRFFEAAPDRRPGVQAELLQTVFDAVAAWIDERGQEWRSREAKAQNDLRARRRGAAEAIRVATAELARLAIEAERLANARKDGDLGHLGIAPVKLIFADAFADRRAENRGFDVVIANPPYVRVQEQDAGAIKRYAKDEGYVAATGSADLYVLFVERALRLLRSGGHLVFIMPSKFHVATYGKGLRGLLAGGRHVAQVIDFVRNQPFGATTYTHILTAAREPQEGFDVFRFEREHAPGEHAFKASGAIARDLARIARGERPAVAGTEHFAAGRLSAEPWLLPVGPKRVLLDRLLAMPDNLETACDSIFQGLVTSADPMYLFEVREVSADGNLVTCFRRSQVHKGSRQRMPERLVELESRWLKPFLAKGDVEAFRVAAPSHVILFPYDVTVEGAVLADAGALQHEAPRTWQWLLDHEQLLRGRESKMDHAGWYGYVYPKNLTLFGAQKLVILSFGIRARFARDDGSYFTGRGDSGYGIKLGVGSPRSHAALCTLLNSPVATFVVAHCGSPFRGGYFSFGKQYIEQIPLPAVDATQVAELERLHDLAVEAKAQGCAGQPLPAELQREMDDYVFRAYGLTETEAELLRSWISNPGADFAAAIEADDAAADDD